MVMYLTTVSKDGYAWRSIEIGSIYSVFTNHKRKDYVVEEIEDRGAYLVLYGKEYNVYNDVSRGRL